VIAGGAGLVHSNSLHDASQQAESADAYVMSQWPMSRAACTAQLTNFDYDRFLPWQHSIQTNPKYQNPFEAVHEAWVLSWNVLCDHFETQVNRLRFDPFNFEQAQLLDCDQIHGNSKHEPIEHVDDTCGAGPNSFEQSRLKCEKSFDYQSITSQTETKSNKSHCKLSFDPNVVIYFGVEDELLMHSCSMSLTDLPTWTHKPWSRRPRKPSPAEIENKPLHIDARIADAHHNVPSTWATEQTQEHEEPIEDPEDANHFLHEAPQSIQNLFDAMQEEGVVTGPRIQESIFLRSWFVHHIHAPQCFQYRVIEINGHWRLWYQDIIDAWRDRILPLEQVIFDIVHPNPPRTSASHEFLFDLIVSQGIQAPRRAGLVTILQRDDRAARASYAVATSLAEQTSGHQIVQNAEYLHGCQIYQCTIRHGRIQIPFSMEPVHLMQDGDSFVVGVASRASGSTDTAHATVEVNHSCQEYEQNDSAFEQDDDPERQSQSNVSFDNIRTGVQIHRLGHQQSHGRIRWDTIDHVLLDVSRLLQLPADDLVNFHHLQINPVDQTDWEESIIVQHVGDIPAGSTERLVLIDIEMHQPHRGSTMPRAPPVSRQVHRVIPTLVRRHVLALTHTAGYCDWHQQDCIVFHNHEIWLQQDQGPRRIEQGAYFRIILPPPPEPAWDIAHALRVFHEAFDLYDQPAAGQIAAAIMNGQDQSRQAVELSDNNLEDATSSMHLSSMTHLGSNSSSSSSIPEDWFIDLQRIVQRYAHACETQALAIQIDPPELEFSVITWLLDHENRRLCQEPKLITLGNDPSEWKADILHAWRHQLLPDIATLLDLVQPTPPRADVEDHIAHVILTQRPSDGSSALLSMEFQGDAPPNVLIRFATVLPRECTQSQVAQAVPLFASFMQNRILWDRPALHHVDQRFHTHWGMSLQVTIVQETQCTAEDDEESTSLFQIATSTNVEPSLSRVVMTHDPVGLSPMTCKGSDHQEDIDVPMTSQHPTTRLHRRPRPLHDGTEQWLFELGSLFSEHAVNEVLDGDSYIYVQTWYVDHVHHRSCLQSRPLRLDQFAVTWIEEFRYLWRDLLDPNVPFSIHVVKPRPPQYRHHGYTCHILLEQNRPRGSVAGVLTAMIIDPSRSNARQGTLIQGAFSTPQFLRLHDVIETLGIQRRCEGRRCRAYHHQEPVHLVLATEVTTGFSIRIDIEASRHQLPIAPAEATSYFDEIVLMQQPGPSVSQEQAAPSPRPSSEPACPTFQFNPDAIAFTPGLHEMSEFVQDLHEIWTRAAVAWEGMQPSAAFITWFVDHRIWYPRCLASRPIRITNRFTDWEAQIKETWNDQIDRQAVHEFHVVLPPNLEEGIAGHIILIQSPREDWVSSLIIIFDNFIGRRSQHMMRLVITTHEHIHIEHVVSNCGYALVHGQLDPNVPCQVWIDGHEIHTGRPWPGRSGHAITLQIHRRVVPMPVVREPAPASEATSFLQLGTHQTIISLDDLIPKSITCLPYHLVHLDFHRELPTELLLEEAATEQEIEQELLKIGHQRHAYSSGLPGKFITVPINWTAVANHYVYCLSSDLAAGELILHSESKPMDELSHMRFLHSCGFIRAVITETKIVREGLHLISFHNNTPELEELPNSARIATPWPAQQPVHTPGPMFDLQQVKCNRPTACMSLGVDWESIESFFHSATDVLCPWVYHLDAPEFVLEGLRQVIDLEGQSFDPTDFDRLIIYTDGSSKSANRRKPPLLVAEKDQPDAWSFVVLGEIYSKHDRPGQLAFLGWQAQQVMYESYNNAYTGTDQIGAEFAEREALIFAGLWRLALNSTVPTIFRTDSNTTADQATGRAGFAEAHQTLTALRGIFQALEAGMKPGDLEVSHVRGHAGDIWNELADHLAKSEASTGHHLHRQSLNLPEFAPILPFLWMLVDHNAGLPNITKHGFDVCPPHLPQPDAPTSTLPKAALSQKPGDLSLSIASLNVGSLFLAPDGFSGKLSYLRQQMQAHAIHVLGLQEARSLPGLSTVDGILRISSGASNGALGVEIWISLTQPILKQKKPNSCIKRSDVQLLHNDPRRLILRVSCPFLNCFFTVLHGPQSGRPLTERQNWWEETRHLVSCMCQHLPNYVMLDANAKTGPTSLPMIFEHDDKVSSNTAFFLEFLTDLELCLPCTSAVHAGSQSTWISPDGLQEHRIDYVAIPQSLLARCTWSCTVPTLDTGNAHHDHIATGLQLDWQDEHVGCRHQNTTTHHDRSKIQTNKSLIDLSSAVVQPWSCDIETQVRALNVTVHEQLQRACPIDRTKPKKVFIDDATWALRAEKLGLKKRLKAAHKQAQFDLLCSVFKQWARKMSTTEHVQAQQHCQSMLCQILRITCQYRQCTRQLKRKLQKLKSEQLQTAIVDAGHNASAGKLLHVMKPFIGSTNPKKCKKACLPIVKKEDGSLCMTPVEAQDRWISFFQQMEGGQRMQQEEYRQHWLRGLEQFLQTETFELRIQDMPTLCDLEVAFRRVQVGKAVGLDEVPPEICHYCPVQLARLCYPILLKAAIHGQEAIEHKGGKMAIAWKNRGDVKDCHTHRSLLISSHVGKTIHRALRQKSHHLYETYMQRQQLGGKLKMPVSIPLHMTRAFLRWKSREAMPTAIVFLDLTEAFYRTLRPLAVGGTLSDHGIGLMCARLGLDSNEMHDLHRLLQEPSAIAEAQAPEHVQRMLQAFHRDTWFQLGQQTDMVRTEIGSRPGDSFADVVFGLLWAKMLKKLEVKLVLNGILESIPDIDLPQPYVHCCDQTQPRIPLLGPTWMDDLSMLICAPSNAALVSKTQTAISLLLDECLDFQMEPNLRRGKTEVMFAFKGAQSRHYRRQYYSGHGGLTVVCERQTYAVSVVPRYLHLGGLIHHRDVNKQEIKRRFAIAHQAFQQHKRLIYRNKNLSWQVRCDIFNTLIMSKLLYGFESWTFPTVQSRLQIHNGVMRLYKRLLGAPHDAHLSDLDILVQTNMPDPTELLRRARLRYFGTLHNCRSHAHWGLLQEDTAWLDLVRDDLQWLWHQVGDSARLADPAQHFMQWRDILVHHGVYWKKLIRRGIQHACLQRKKEFYAIDLHSRIGRLLMQEGWIDNLPDHDKSATPAVERCFGCMQCKRNFASFAGESVHMCRTHGIFAKERYLFDGTHCPHCLKEYHTHSKVLAHLRNTERCRTELRNRKLHCQPAPGIGSTADRELVEIQDGALPLLQAQGPKLQTPVPRAWDAFDIPFLEAIYMHLVECDQEVVLYDSIRHFIGAYPISWTQCQLTLEAFCSQFTQADADVLGWSHAEVLQCIRAMAQASSWEFLTDKKAAVVHRKQADLQDWENWCADLATAPPTS